MKYSMIFISLIFFILIGCNAPIDQSDFYLPTQKTIESDQMEYTLTINKSIFSRMDILEISFKVLNKSSNQKVFDFKNQQQLGIRLKNFFGRSVISYPGATSPAISSFSLLPGESEKLFSECSFTDYKGEYITGGRFCLTVNLLDQNSPELSLIIIVK